MLEIIKNDKVALPKKHHEANNVLAHVYDLLTEVFADEYYSTLKKTNVNFHGQEELKNAFVDKKIDVLDILKAHKKNDELVEVLTKHLTLGILNDMINFLYEAINIAKKGKMPVAYALLRKPFTDELLILEQLLVDKEDFINRFYHEGDIKKYDPSDSGLDKKTIIRSAVSCININVMYDADFIYKLRYDKEMNAGINGITNQALHVVTGHSKYRTANQNLNFVFSNEDDTNTQWEHFYTAVPMLLMYTTSVADKILFQYIDDFENRLFYKNLKRVLAYLMVYSKSSPKKTKIFYRELGKCFTNECTICKNKNELVQADFGLFFYQGIFLCSNCFNPIMFDNDVLDKVNELLFGKEARPSGDV